MAEGLLSAADCKVVAVVVVADVGVMLVPDGAMVGANVVAAGRRVPFSSRPIRGDGGARGGARGAVRKPEADSRPDCT